MAEIEVHCEVPLAEPIVLATQADTHYAPIQWKLSSGDQVVIRMDAPEAAAKAHWAGHSSTPNYFVNTRVEKQRLACWIWPPPKWYGAGLISTALRLRRPPASNTKIRDIVRAECKKIVICFPSREVSDRE